MANSMHVEDLDHKELLELDSEGGVIYFAGQRALLFDAVAMGLLRKYLVENCGITMARIVLTQFGFAHGWRMAEAMQSTFKWEHENEWHCACTKMHALAGLFCIEEGSEDPLSKNGAVILSSYEAEQHLLYFGLSDSPVCWTISGMMSGYTSRITRKEIFVLEDRCKGKGHAACSFIGRTREEWGKTHDEELGFFEPGRIEESLGISISSVTETLKAAELKLHARRHALTRMTNHTDEPHGMVAKSLVMQQLIDLARRVAKVDATILITGESGSGKERIARLVHDESPRASGPFIAINCGAITETLLESELFGHTKGAFTGANCDRQGLFEAANGGTLLLDEIGEISPGMQIKLLRVLQERELRRVGENKNRRINVRVLAATNRDLAFGVAGGNFRQDLYYRLKVVELHLSSLRERRDDILPLARILLSDAALRMNRNITSISIGAAEQLMRYEWPGNVRELENTMERAVALARGNRVELEDLPDEIRQVLNKPVISDGSVRPLDIVEKEYILAALDQNSGNQTHTAKQLQIGSATLYRKLKSYGVINANQPVIKGFLIKTELFDSQSNVVAK